jgi:toxin ParE1/3/4
MQVRWTRPAAQDLESIARRIRQDNPAAALRIAKAIYDRCMGLERFPHRGRNGRIAGTREMVFAPLPYIAVYRVTDDAVEILRIYHSSRNWP